FACSDVPQCQAGSRKDTRGRYPNTDRLPQPTGCLALERGTHRIPAHEVVDRAAERGGDNQQNDDQQQDNAAKHGRLLRQQGTVPELPDILLYLRALEPRILGRRITGVRLANPFLLRSVEPPLSAVGGRTVIGLRRLGKRIVIELDDGLFLIFHLMVAGRFRWKPPGSKIPGKVGLLAIDFEHGTLILTEAGSKRQASLHVVEGGSRLAQHDPGGLDVMDADLPAFAEALRRTNHTLKR